MRHNMKLINYRAQLNCDQLATKLWKFKSKVNSNNETSIRSRNFVSLCSKCGRARLCGIGGFKWNLFTHIDIFDRLLRVAMSSVLK